MQIVAVGVSHNSTSIALREQVAVAGDEVPNVLACLREHVGEGFIISTCNRVEVYAVCGHATTGAERLRHVLASHRGVPLDVLREASYAYSHRSAVRHLLRVAAGLDSAIVGEHEILGQIRRALGAARQAAALGPLLDRLGDAALACGKRARSVTAFGRVGESMASLGLRLLARERGALNGAHVVVLGAGETAGHVLAWLAKVPDVRLTVLNRTFDRAATIAADHHATARRWETLGEVLADADVVIGCTASPEPLIDAATLARSRDGSRVLHCVDLGVPRDIAASAAAVPGVRLIDLSRIEAEATATRAARGRAVARADAIVEQETERYMEWWRGRSVAATIARLHARAGAIRDAELERALLRLSNLPPQAREVVRDLATRVVGKLLHEPTLALKRDEEGANMALIVERLFALGGADRVPAKRPDAGEPAPDPFTQPIAS